MGNGPWFPKNLYTRVRVLLGLLPGRDHLSDIIPAKAPVFRRFHLLPTYLATSYLPPPGWG
jgi:hypothetical protein